MSASAVGHRFPLTGLFDLPNNSPAVSRRPSLSLSQRKLVREGGGRRRLYCKAAASPSFSGSGAEYSSEQLLGARKQKKGKIAGVDQDELVDPSVLADPDSCFCEFKGVKIHHKICDAELEERNSVPSNTSLDIPAQTRKLGVPMILLHGFGASTFSWNPVMKPLAKISGSKVLAFDRPAFGLTSRVDPFKHSYVGNEVSKPLNPYSLAFSVMATLYFIDFLSAQKVILVGHSAGSLVAVDTYFEAPERIAAMILVAPAIVAPPTSDKFPDENDQSQASPNSNIPENPAIRFFSILANFSRYIAQAIMHLVKRVVNFFNSLYKKALSAFLRSYIAAILVRIAIDKFGTTGVRSAWYDAKKVTEGILDGYTKPLRIKGWDRALLEFTAAMLTDSEPDSKPPLAKRLKQIRCPVLIVTGESDRLVPSWNSERLSQAIPGSRFKVIKNCGHLPQEEKPEEFVSVVTNFLQSIFGGLEADMQAAT